MPRAGKPAQKRGAARKGRTRRLGEARAAYRAEPSVPVAPFATARISAKNQITLPVAVMRAMGLKPGDELQMLVLGNLVRARKRLHGRELIDHLYGSANLPDWRTAEDIEAYVQRERDSWDRDWDETTS